MKTSGSMLDVQHASDKNREDLTFMVAVYKERADIHARLAEQVKKGETLDPLFPDLLRGYGPLQG
jgi:hypothetical protein